MSNTPDDTQEFKDSFNHLVDSEETLFGFFETIQAMADKHRADITMTVSWSPADGPVGIDFKFNRYTPEKTTG